MAALYGICLGGYLRRRRWVFAAALALATVQAASPAFAFRTLESRPDLAGQGRIRWNSRAVEFRVASQLPENLSHSDVMSAVRAGLQPWSDVACTDFEFVLVNESGGRARRGDGINTIELVATDWNKNGNSDETSGATDLELEERPDGGWAIVEADIRINAENFVWAATPNPPEGAYSLYSVVTHEAGHALGLTHPCEPGGADGAPRCSADEHEADESLMYPFYAQVQTDLFPDDVAGVCSLYPRCEVEGCAEGHTCTQNGCEVVCGSKTCDAAEVCVKDECIPASECPNEDCSGCGPGGCGSECPGEAGCSCLVDLDCAASGVCLPSGVCAEPCTASKDCAANAVCIEFGGGGGYCGEPGLLALGEECSEANECAGNQCLAGESEEPICTQLCDSEHRCPSGWACTTVEGRDVCTPLAPSGGCAVREGRSADGSSLFSTLFLLGLSASFVARLRRRSER